MFSLFRRPHYSSEITDFIEEMKEKKPTLEAEQRAGRALLWDKHLDRERAGRVQRGAGAAAALRLPDPGQVGAEARRHGAALASTAARTKTAHRCVAAMPEVVDQVALARLYGEPLFALPNDLYIPPEALEVFLEAFEGPLDLLLYLIRKQNFNILDIPMARADAPVPGLRRRDPRDATWNWRPSTC